MTLPLQAALPCPLEAVLCPRAVLIFPMLLRSGKYRGFCYEHVKANDKRYCGWLLDAARRQEDLPKDLRKFAARLDAEQGGILHDGAHKGSDLVHGYL